MKVNHRISYHSVTYPVYSPQYVRIWSARGKFAPLSYFENRKSERAVPAL
ncbi:hypothetical protein [Bacteroides eggerthii]|nr:hypothetical protein [Bacteroides eggerthii]